MIRRHSPRSPRGHYQDFHFFAASERPNSFESHNLPSPPTPPAIPSDPATRPELPCRISGAAEGPQPLPNELPLTPSDSPSEHPATPLRPQPPTHRILIPLTPEAAARLGIVPQAPVPAPEPPEDEPPGTEALERAMEYLARSGRVPVSPMSSEPPAIEQMEATSPKSAPGRASTKRPKRSAPSKARLRKRKGASHLAVPRRTRASKARHPSTAAISRTQHENQCTICAHPYRAEIENEFLHWHTLGHIAYDYKVSRSAIYRHAYAEGLFSRRNHRLRFALGHLIERVQDVEPTADSIVRAIHAFARINDDGEWVDPPAHVIISSGGVHREAASGGARRPVAIPLDSTALAGVIDVPAQPFSAAREGGTVNRPPDHATR